MAQQPNEQPQDQPIYNVYNQTKQKLEGKTWDDFETVLLIALGFWLGGGRHLKKIARNTAATRHGVDELRKLAAQPIVVLPK